MLNQPNTVNFTSAQPGVPEGPSPLLRFQVPTEGLDYLGLVKTFVLTKKGVFDPAPIFTFDYTVIVDAHSSNITDAHVFDSGTGTAWANVVNGSS